MLKALKKWDKFVFRSSNSTSNLSVLPPGASISALESLASPVKSINNFQYTSPSGSSKQQQHHRNKLSSANTAAGGGSSNLEDMRPKNKV